MIFVPMCAGFANHVAAPGDGRAPGIKIADEDDGTRKRKICWFKKFCCRIFRPWLWPKAALKPPQSKRCAKAERPPRREAFGTRRFIAASTRSRRVGMAARRDCGDSFTGSALAAVGYRDAGGRPATRVIFAKRTQIKLGYKRLIMRILINKLLFSKSRKRTQIEPKSSQVVPASTVTIQMEARYRNPDSPRPGERRFSRRICTLNPGTEWTTKQNKKKSRRCPDATIVRFTNRIALRNLPNCPYSNYNHHPG